MTSSQSSETNTPDQVDISRSPQSKHLPDISPGLQAVLQNIVDDVLRTLGCVGAMVAPLEAGNCLRVRAYAVDVEPGLLEHLEKTLGVSMIGPESVAYLDDESFKDNLSVRAVKGSDDDPPGVVVSDSLYDLFRPVVDRSLADLAQRLSSIKQVIAVPFFLEDEVVGNLFVAARQVFSRRDIDFLIALGRQAATAIQSQQRLDNIQAMEQVSLALQTYITDETQILQTIVDAVVEKLGYAGAMVAPLEADNSLPVRAYAVDMAQNLLKQMEEKLGVSMIGPQSVAYLDDERFKDNLSVKAVKGADGPPGIVVSDKLYDLFCPVVSKPLADMAQQLAGIKQVIAIPFFIEDEAVGNLFVATRKPSFSESEREMLKTFGQQAAVGIRNARLYRKAEEQQQIAQMFGKMAFSAAAYIHTLRNHVGVSMNYLQLVQMIPQLSEERRLRVIESAPEVIKHLNEAVEVLDNLHKPWRQPEDVLTNVNDCLARALGKVFPEAAYGSEQADTENELGIAVHRLLSPGLPQIKTMPDMLTEAFRVLIRNAVEAIERKDSGGELWVESRLGKNSIIEISIRDNGIGIKPENLGKIFEMGWSTKEGKGMGFGLFWTRDYIEGLGGSIGVESAWQEGTTFHLTIPVPTAREG
ncbi:MAG: GAF domain-containing sensor histidine kinase [Anaerolineae bacterium]|nr:GAF domain-containing sensor histidine kinase [Anaerolineae bacterium]